MSHELYRIITDNEKIINKERLKKDFGYNNSSDMRKELSTTKATPTNEIVADITKDDLDRLKKGSVTTPWSKHATGYPHKIVCSVKKILDFKNRENQKEHGLKY